MDGDIIVVWMSWSSGLVPPSVGVVLGGDAPYPSTSWAPGTTSLPPGARIVATSSQLCRT